MTTTLTPEQFLASQPAEVGEFERTALTGVLLTRLHDLPELSAAPDEFRTGALPFIVRATVDRYADVVTAEEANALGCVRRWNPERFITEGFMADVAAATATWAKANR